MKDQRRATAQRDPLGSIGLALCLLVILATAATADDVARHALTLSTTTSTPPGPPLAVAVDAPATVDQLRDALQGRGNFQLQKEATPEQFARQSLRDQVRAWVNQIKPTARHMMLYYRGRLHGDATQPLRLAHNEARSPEGDLPLDQLFPLLEQCTQGESAIVFLDLVDSCPAAKLESLLADQLRKQAKSRLAIAVVASTENQQQGTPGMAYWLSQGLKGKADHDGNRKISLSEMVTYLNRQMSDGRRTVVSASNGRPIPDVLDVRPIKLDELIEDLAEQLALTLRGNQVAYVAVPDFRIKNDMPVDPAVPGQDHGPLMRYCVRKLKSELAQRSKYSYVMDDDWLRKLLNQESIGPDAIRTRRMNAIAQAVRREKHLDEGPVAVVLGELHHLGGSQIELRVTPWQAQNGATLTRAGGLALLNPAEWAMIGQSAADTPRLLHFTSPPPSAASPDRTSPPTTQRPTTQRPTTQRPTTQRPTTQRPTTQRPTTRSPSPRSSGKSSGQPVAKVPSDRTRPPLRQAKPLPLLDYFLDEDQEQVEQTVARLQQSAGREHPMLQADFPFQLWLTVDGKPRARQVSADKRKIYYVLRAGESYEINIANRSPHDVFVRLLVDGLNTLPDHPLTTSKDLFEVNRKNVAVPRQAAQHVNLTNARAWYCRRDEYRIAGFYTSIGKQELLTSSHRAIRANFEVTDASNAEAWKKGYPNDVGIITAAFFAPQSRPTNLAPQGGLGTMPGKEAATKVNVYSGTQVPGDLLAVLHLHYGR